MSSKAGPDDWKRRGEYFGYPRCCIDFFCDNFDDLGDIHNKREKEIGALYLAFIGMSHVPCPKCYATLVRQKEYMKKYFIIKEKK